MRLSIDSYYPQVKFGDREGLKMIKDAGFDCVDYSFYYYDDDHPLFAPDGVEYARQIREYMDSIGLICSQAHADFALEYGEAWKPETRNYFRILRSMECAAVLGAPQIVVHAVTVREQSAQFIEDYNYDFYKTLEPYAEKFGIRISVENLFNTDRKRNTFINRRCGTPELVNSMIQRLDSEWFNVCVDLGHASMTGFEPEEFLAALTPGTVCGLHVQDTDYRGDRHQLPFIGDMKWDEIMKTLKQIGYEGDLTYEIPGYLGRIPLPLYPAALSYAHEVGRYLIGLFDRA